MEHKEGATQDECKPGYELKEFDEVEHISFQNSIDKAKTTPKGGFCFTNQLI